MLVPSKRIAHSILPLHGQEVFLDADPAEHCGAPTKVLAQAVKRNPEHFTDDFMFQLANQEVNVLRSQFVTLNS